MTKTNQKSAVFEAIPLSRNKIRDITTIVRNSYCFNNSIYFPIVEVIEAMSVSDDFDFDYEIKEFADLPYEEAKTYPNENKIEIRCDVYDKAVKGDGRSRLTIAHELGHYFLHKEKNISFSRATDFKEIPAFKNPEWQANAFAGELLIPKHLVKGMSIEEVMEKCKTSREATMYQLRKYGYI